MVQAFQVGDGPTCNACGCRGTDVRTVCCPGKVFPGTLFLDNTGGVVDAFFTMPPVADIPMVVTFADGQHARYDVTGPGTAFPSYYFPLGVLGPRGGEMLLTGYLFVCGSVPIEGHPELNNWYIRLQLVEAGFGLYSELFAEPVDHVPGVESTAGVDARFPWVCDPVTWAINTTGYVGLAPANSTWTVHE